MLNKKRLANGIPTTFPLPDYFLQGKTKHELELSLQKACKDTWVKSRYALMSEALIESVSVASLPIIYYLARGDIDMDYDKLIIWWDRYIQLVNSPEMKETNLSVLNNTQNNFNPKNTIYRFLIQLEEFLLFAKIINVSVASYFELRANNSIGLSGYLQNCSLFERGDVLAKVISESKKEQDHVTCLLGCVAGLRYSTDTDLDLLFYLGSKDLTNDRKFAQAYFQKAVSVAYVVDERMRNNP